MKRDLVINCLYFKRAIVDYFPKNTRVSNLHGGFMLWVELDIKIDAAIH